jgi:hypothetical protein
MAVRALGGEAAEEQEPGLMKKRRYDLSLYAFEREFARRSGAGATRT